MNKYLRKKLLINKPFQLKIMGLSVILTLFIGAIFFVNHIYFLYTVNQLLSLSDISYSHALLPQLQQMQSLMLNVFIASFAILLPLILGFGLILSHKIAGPLYRLEKYFLNDEYLKENQALSFRKGDFFQELPEAINNSLNKKKN